MCQGGDVVLGTGQARLRWTSFADTHATLIDSEGESERAVRSGAGLRFEPESTFCSERDDRERIQRSPGLAIVAGGCFQASRQPLVGLGSRACGASAGPRVSRSLAPGLRGFAESRGGCTGSVGCRGLRVIARGYHRVARGQRGLPFELGAALGSDSSSGSCCCNGSRPS